MNSIKLFVFGCLSFVQNREERRWRRVGRSTQLDGVRCPTLVNLQVANLNFFISRKAGVSS